MWSVDISDGPVRTCVGCRERAVATDLLRVVLVGHEVVADPAHRLPGRGAWLHPVEGCLALAERRRAFGRALRVSGFAPDTATVRTHVAQR
ncbi:YlxR family protein [Fodinicola feengrottensis]|uniref:YlxR family protein n=1 Tax=Fodinicola feengrottensis TaxID=435914 RepID=UPI0013D897AB|nr:YlxR family protein [Fodinicola feengrottensis]